MGTTILDNVGLDKMKSAALTMEVMEAICGAVNRPLDFRVTEKVRVCANQNNLKFTRSNWLQM